MKAQIDMSATLLKKVTAEAERTGYTVDEWLAEAAEKQLRKAEQLRQFAAERAKGASKEKAQRALATVRAWANEPVQPGDELPPT